MRYDIFSSMQRQMTPGPSLLEAVKAAASTAKPRRRQTWKYASIAAVAAIAIAAYPMYRYLAPSKPALHSFVTVEGGVRTEDMITTTGQGPDQGKTAGQGQYAGWNAPGGALVGESTPVGGGDVAVQEGAVMAYQNLMAYFEETYGPNSCPEWYGGSYIQGSVLIVNLVESFEPVEKEFLLEIQGWAQSGDVGFGNVKYSYAYLRDLQDHVDEKLLAQGLAVGSGVNEMTGQLEVSLTGENEEALALLAELDPEGDAILVKVGEAVAVDGLLPVESPLMVGSDLDGLDYAVTEPEVEDVPPIPEPMAVETVDRLPEELPQEKLPQTVECNTPAYDPLG